MEEHVDHNANLPGVGGNPLEQGGLSTDIPGNPELGLDVLRGPAVPEELRRMEELYTVRGNEIIKRIKEAKEFPQDKKLLGRVFEDATAFREGLLFGKYGAAYDLDNKGIVNTLQTMFLTKEGSMARPDSAQVDAALDDMLTSKPAEAKDYALDKIAWQEDKYRSYQRRNYLKLLAAQEANNVYEADMSQETREELWKQAGETAATVVRKKDAYEMEKWLPVADGLLVLHSVSSARAEIDLAFRYTQSGCKSDGQAVELLNRIPELDKTQWDLVFQRHLEVSQIEFAEENPEAKDTWGHAVDRVMRKIADPDNRNRYVNGMQGPEFKKWLSELLDESKIGGRTRMDVVWNAWKIAKITGLTDSICWTVDRKTGKYKFANPPIGDDLESNQQHNEKHRALEWGWKATDADGNVMDLDRREVWKITDYDDGSEEWKLVLSARWGADSASRRQNLLNLVPDQRARNLMREQGLTAPEIRKELFYKFGINIERKEELENMATYEKHLEENYLNQEDLRLSSMRKAVNQNGVIIEVEIKEHTELAKSGLPVSIGRVGGLLVPYFEGIESKQWPHPGNMPGHFTNLSLQEIWEQHEISMADERFPFYRIIELEEQEPDSEVGMGTMGGRNLTKFRNHGWRAKLQNVVLPTKDFSAELITGSDLRTGKKIKTVDPAPKELWVNGRPTNPWFWLMLGYLDARAPFEYSGKATKYTKGERRFRPQNYADTWVIGGTQKKYGKLVLEEAVRDQTLAGRLSVDEGELLKKLFTESNMVASNPSA